MACHHLHSLGRKRRDVDVRGVGRGKVADDAAQWMGCGHFVVAIGDCEHRGKARNAPRHELDEVERRFVGPMGVLDHHERGLRSQLGDHRVEEVAAFVARLEQPAKRGGGFARDITQGTQRVRRLERVARAPPDASRVLLGRATQEARLAHARLAADEQRVPFSPGGAAEAIANGSECALPFEEVRRRFRGHRFNYTSA